MKILFAEQLRLLRLSEKLSQRALAKKTGLSASAIKQWENGRRVPNADAVARLAKFFGVTADYLLGLEE